jgi:hypothetical protein
MAVFTPPTTKNSPPIQKQGKKFNGTATEYAPPHTMDNKPVSVTSVHAGVADNKEYLRNANVSVANSRSNDYPPTKTSGIQMRGTGAATKGKMSRGPMA